MVRADPQPRSARFGRISLIVSAERSAMSQPPSRVGPSMLGAQKGKASPPPERGSALDQPQGSRNQVAAALEPTPVVATAHAGLKKQGLSKARVNLTYRASQERQEWLRRFVFEERTTIQDLINAALRRMLPGIPD